MKKIYSLILAFIAEFGVCASATQRTVGQFSFDDAYMLTNAMCILDDTTVWYQITVDNPSSAFYSITLSDKNNYLSKQFIIKH